MNSQARIPPIPDPAARAVRIFVSSTFRDMIAERDELATRAWPALRALCEERAVTITDVDLRWGITREQSERGEVLPICLAEIDASRPYSIGILGERYGWAPEEILEHIVAQMPWLAEHKSHSVTEWLDSRSEATPFWCSGTPWRSGMTSSMRVTGSREGSASRQMPSACRPRTGSTRSSIRERSSRDLGCCLRGCKGWSGGAHSPLVVTRCGA